MTSQVARLYVFAISLLVFFVLWATIAAHPWTRTATTRSSASSRNLAVLEQRLRADAELIKALGARSKSTPSAPVVRVVALPPLTTTRTS
ncbi:MAG TPA: hypothetical protein VFV56_07710 [Gaiellaceae bacterium]|jgi:hypothetical protein|nr:hypothetical protein [Gaiellaceae bacterium]